MFTQARARAASALLDYLELPTRVSERKLIRATRELERAASLRRLEGASQQQRALALARATRAHRAKSNKAA